MTHQQGRVSPPPPVPALASHAPDTRRSLLTQPPSSPFPEGPRGLISVWHTPGLYWWVSTVWATLASYQELLLGHGHIGECRTHACVLPSITSNKGCIMRARLLYKWPICPRSWSCVDALCPGPEASHAGAGVIFSVCCQKGQPGP